LLGCGGGVGGLVVGQAPQPPPPQTPNPQSPIPIISDLNIKIKLIKLD